MENVYKLQWGGVLTETERRVVERELDRTIESILERRTRKCEPNLFSDGGF